MALDLERLARDLGTSRERTASVGSVGGSSYLRDLARDYGSTYSPGVSRESLSFGGRAAEFGLGAARGIASTLEPLQLPKDVLDAIIAGNLDPSTTITERLRRLRFATYAPFGAAPPRAADGDEILGLLGMEEGRTRRWLGVGFDLFADPLLVGSYLRIGGRLTKVDELINLGNRVDTFMAPAAANRGLNRLIPAKQEFVDQRLTAIADSMLNSRVFWESGAAARTYGDVFLPRTVALERQIPGFGARIHASRQLGLQAGREAERRALGLLEEAVTGLLGESAPGFFRRATQILSGGLRQSEAILNRIPTVMRESIARHAYEVAGQRGIATYRSTRAELGAVEELAGFVGMAHMSKGQANAVTKARREIRELAQRVWPDNVDTALNRFDEFTQRIVEVDALLGYHLSGIEFIKTSFMQSVANAVANRGVDLERFRVTAEGMWRDVVRAGMSATKKDFDVYTMDTVGGVVLKEVFGESVSTLRDLLSRGHTAFSKLDLTAYLKSLQNGHMRRAYGLFQDSRSFDRYLRSVREGRILPSNILDEDHLDAIDLSKDGRKAITEYVEALRSRPGAKPRGGGLPSTGRQGLVISRTNLIQHLIDRGFSPRDANQEIAKLIKGLSDDGALSRIVDELTELANKYDKLGIQSSAGTGFSRFFRQRKDFGEQQLKKLTDAGVKPELAVEQALALERDVLTRLGELASPAISLTEGARASRTVIPMSRFLADIYDEAANKLEPLISSQRGFTNAAGVRYVHVPDSRLYGPFAGQYIHPMLRKEIDRAFIQGARGRNVALSRLRSLITGGYLASPNVIAANFVGGIYTSALAGISPASMLRSIIGTWGDFRKASADPNRTFDDLEILKEFISLNDSSMIDLDIVTPLKNMRGAARELDPQGVERAFKDIVEFLQGQLKAPLGVTPRVREITKWAGLDGFQFVENLMKVSAFRAARRARLAEEGMTLQRYRQLRAENPSSVRSIDQYAAEKARIAVFDYSELPDSLRFLRDTGLILFPGFNYFLMGRTLGAALNRPGILAGSDRLSEAVWNLALPEDERYAVWASLPDWLKDEQGVPIRIRRDREGHERVSIIPGNQLAPTASYLGNPWGESLASIGIWKPLVEVLSANLITRDGTAPFSQRYGQRVFQESATPAEAFVQSAGFLANNLAPGVLRKLASYTPGTGFRGLVATPISNHLQKTLPGPLADSIYTLNEVSTLRAQRDVWDEAIAGLLRSPQPMAMSGPLTAFRGVLRGSKAELDRKERDLKERAERALLRGDRAEAERLARRVQQLRAEWVERMQPLIEMFQGGQ